MEPNQAGDGEEKKDVIYKNINPLKLSWCDKKTKFTKESRYSSKITRLEVDYKEMYKLIRCLDCYLIPHPQGRFICLKGHMFCYKCGKNRYDKNGEVCLALEHQPTSEDKPQLCQSNLKRVKNDPVYATLIGQNYWRCPNRVKGCKARIWGAKIFRHYRYCKVKYDKLDKIMAEANARWENDEWEEEPITRPVFAKKASEEDEGPKQNVPESTSTEDECWD